MVFKNLSSNLLINLFFQMRFSDESLVSHVGQ